MNRYRSRPSRGLTPRKFYGALLVLMIAAVPVLYAKYRLDLRPVAAQGQNQTFAVAAGENAQRIATHLRTAGLIRDRNAFITYVNLHGLRPQLKVGTYTVSPHLSAAQIAELLASGKTLSRRLLVPEGYRICLLYTSPSPRD